jgi:hypothetical protein
MVDQTDTSNDVIILPADKTLMQKLGGVSLDVLLSPDAVKKAETVLATASEDLYLDCVKAAAELRSVADASEKNKKAFAAASRAKIISLAFAIKAKAGQCGYTLVAALAKSLHTRCEEIPAEQTTLAALKIIAWHAQSIEKLLTLNVDGDGGEMGKAIMAEIEKLKLSPET